MSDQAFAEHIQQVEAAFPAYELIADELIAERNLVALRGTFQGVHRGTLRGVPATGRPVSAGLMIFYGLKATASSNTGCSSTAPRSWRS